MVLLYIIIATVFVSLVSLIGAVSFLLKSKSLDKLIFLLVAFGAGSLLGGAFFHLIPESYENNFKYVGLMVMGGFVLFFLLEKLLHWHHHSEECEKDHSLSYLILIGDGLHNLIDGIIIASAFLVNVQVGIITTIIVMAHEIPQEIGDIAILLHNGLSKSKALLFNFLSTLPAIIGALLGYFLSMKITSLSNYLIPLAAGGFIYIAASDLIPEINKKRTKTTTLFFIVGLVVMYLFTFIG